MTPNAIERALRHDRGVIAIALVVVTVLCWAPMVASGGDGAPPPCCLPRLGPVAAMWATMMVGMMLPAASPMVLTHAAVVRRRHGAAPFASSAALLAGYLSVWLGFSGLAALAQVGLHRAAHLYGPTLALGPLAGAAVLLAAGLFQLVPAKTVCLERCRSPVGYLFTSWRDGRSGALAIGIKHGAFCLGCCWLLMAVPFALGIMDLFWALSLTAFIVAEKVAPWPRAVAWTGGALSLAGAARLFVSALSK